MKRNNPKHDATAQEASGRLVAKEGVVVVVGAAVAGEVTLGADFDWASAALVTTPTILDRCEVCRELISVASMTGSPS
jgi:hypothetical protein